MVPGCRVGRGELVSAAVVVVDDRVGQKSLAGAVPAADFQVDDVRVTLVHKMERGSIREVRKLKWGRLGPKVIGGDSGAHRNRGRTVAVVRTPVNKCGGLGAS